MPCKGFDRANLYTYPHWLWPNCFLRSATVFVLPRHISQIDLKTNLAEQINSLSTTSESNETTKHLTFDRPSKSNLTFTEKNICLCLVQRVLFGFDH